MGKEVPHAHESDGPPLPDPAQVVTHDGVNVNTCTAGADLTATSVENRFYSRRADINEVKTPGVGSVVSPGEAGVHTSTDDHGMPAEMLKHGLYSRCADVNKVKTPGVDSVASTDDHGMPGKMLALPVGHGVHKLTDDRGMPAKTLEPGLYSRRTNVNEVKTPGIDSVASPEERDVHTSGADQGRRDDPSFDRSFSLSGQGGSVRRLPGHVLACGGSAPEIGAGQELGSEGFQKASQTGDLPSFGHLARQASLHIKDPLVQALTIAHPKAVNRTLQMLSSGKAVASPPATQSTRALVLLSSCKWTRGGSGPLGPLMWRPLCLRRFSSLQARRRWPPWVHGWPAYPLCPRMYSA